MHKLCLLRPCYVARVNATLPLVEEGKLRHTLLTDPGEPRGAPTPEHSTTHSISPPPRPQTTPPAQLGRMWAPGSAPFVKKAFAICRGWKCNTTRQHRLFPVESADQSAVRDCARVHKYVRLTVCYIGSLSLAVPHAKRKGVTGGRGGRLNTPQTQTITFLPGGGKGRGVDIS